METAVVRRAALLFLLLAVSAAGAAAEQLRYGIALPQLQMYEDTADAQVLTYDQRFVSAAVGPLEHLFSREYLTPLLFQDDEQSAPMFERVSAASVPFHEGRINSLYKPAAAAFVMAEGGYDRLILRSFARVDQFISLELYEVDNDLAYERFFREIITRENADLVIERSRTALFEQITGKKTGTLVIEQQHDRQMHITVEGYSFIGEEPLFAHLPEGHYQVGFAAEGRQIDTRRVEITAGEKLVLTPPEIRREPSSHYITAYPGGGEIFISAQSVAAAPALIELRDPGLITAQIVTEGYAYPSTFALSPEKLEYKISLRPDWQERSRQTEIGSAGFYRSLGGTVLSLPISIISLFMYDVTGHGAWRVGAAAGASLTSLLLVETAVRLADYYHRID